MAKLKGWYYDKQLDSPLTSVTLHANMWWDGKTFINWDKISGENGFGKNKNKCDLDKYETILGAAKGACGYGMDPICTSILNEDFNIGISNTWSEFGGDPIGDMWNSLRGPMSGVAKPIVESMKTLYENNKKRMEQTASGEKQFHWVTDKISRLVDWIGGNVSDITESKDIDVVSFLNKALITNGTRFSYYGGTGIAFGNLVMKFTVFPKWEEGSFIEVPEQVIKLYPYFIGQMESFEDVTGIGPDPEGAPASYTGMIKEAANTCFWFQKPPGGYETEMRGIDAVQKGTLKLKIGNFYEIANLVCSDVTLNFSKNMVKNPITQMISPLFCDVSITLRPSTKYSDKALRTFVGGSKEARNTLKNIMRDNIDKEKKSIKSAVEAKVSYLNGEIPNPTYIIDQDVNV